MTMIGAAATAFRATRAARPRKTRTPVLVHVARFAARALPEFATVRRVTLHLGAFGAIDYGMFELSRVAGLVAIGVSLLLLDFLAGGR